MELLFGYPTRTQEGTQNAIGTPKVGALISKHPGHD